MADAEPTQRLNPNSALYWYPATETIAQEYDGLQVPETQVVEFDFMDCLGVLDGERPAALPTEDLAAAVDAVGDRAFIRTDLTSAKHSGLRAIQATTPTDAERVASWLIGSAAQKSMFPAAFLIREWVDIESQFTAFDGLPIGVEYRVFSTPDEHLCTHYYWPEESLEDADPSSSMWRTLRKDIEAVRTPPWLGAAARGVAFEADFQHGIDDPERAWSVDFARDIDGGWWLIDMALADESWHPACEHAEEGADG